MARKLLPQEFYRLMADKLDIEESIAKKYWEHLIELFSDELADYGEIDLPYFCFISMKMRGGLKKIPNSEADKIRLNTTEKFRVENLEPYYVVNFKPKEEFKETSKGKRVTRAEIKRARSDYEKQKQIDDNRKIQLAFRKRQEAFMKALLEDNKERIKEQKKFNRLSKKKQREILAQEGSYWEDFEEMEGNN